MKKTLTIAARIKNLKHFSVERFAGSKNFSASYFITGPGVGNSARSAQHHFEGETAKLNALELAEALEVVAEHFAPTVKGDKAFATVDRAGLGA